MGSDDLTDFVDDSLFPYLQKFKQSGTSANTVELTSIIERAGLETWPKLFQNLRASRATELAYQFPSNVAAAWLGHAEGVADADYPSVTDDHFTKAVENGALLTHQGATPGYTERQSKPATNKKPRRTGVSLKR